ncbi:MAG: hypothetical protein AB1665_01115 [Candidatus Thermoplasmatota archaeon]
MNKIRAGIAIGLCALMLASGFYMLGTARAEDVATQWFEEIPGAPAGVTFYDVAWNPTGEDALFVGVNSTGVGKAYFYEPMNATGATNVWRSANNIGDPATGITLRCVEWDPSGERFIVMGNCAGGSWFQVSAGTGWVMQRTNDPDFITGLYQAYDLVFDSYYNTMVVVGGNTSATNNTPASFKLTANDWKWLTSEPGMPGGKWHGVEATTGPMSLYFVGEWPPNQGIYHQYDWSNLSYLASFGGCILTDIAYDGANDRMIMTAANRTGMDAVYIAVGPSYTALAGYGNSTQVPDTTHLWGLDVDANGRAIIVGWNGSHGMVYDFYTMNATTKLVKRSYTTSLFSGKKFQAVAVRPAGIPMALTAGSAFKYSYTAVTNPIQVSTVYPHIEYLEMYFQNGVASVLNSMRNVDPGDSSNWYTLTVQGYYNGSAGGAAAIDQVDVYMWFDNGGTGVDGSGGVGVLGDENLGIHLRWTSAGAFSIVYPTTGETLLYGAGGTARRGIAGGMPTNDNYSFNFTFMPRQQVRNASGDGGWSAGSGAAPGRYRLAADGIEDQTSPGTVLNDAWSWDIKADVWDLGTANASAYDEFGIYKFVELKGSGLPGAVSGSGAPLQTITLSPTGDVNFSANCRYDLTVNVTDLTGQNLGGTIGANALRIQGGEIGAPIAFGGAGISQWLLGASGPGNGEGPRDNRTWTTTTNGAGDGLGVGIPVTWSCVIPAVAEDQYTGTVTYAVVVDP